MICGVPQRQHKESEVILFLSLKSLLLLLLYGIRSVHFLACFTATTLLHSIFFLKKFVYVPATNNSLTITPKDKYPSLEHLKKFAVRIWYGYHHDMSIIVYDGVRSVQFLLYKISHIFCLSATEKSTKILDMDAERPKLFKK